MAAHPGHQTFETRNLAGCHFLSGLASIGLKKTREKILQCMLSVHLRFFLIVWKSHFVSCECQHIRYKAMKDETWIKGTCITRLSPPPTPTPKKKKMLRTLLGNPQSLSPSPEVPKEKNDNKYCYT